MFHNSKNEIAALPSGARNDIIIVFFVIARSFSDEAISKLSIAIQFLKFATTDLRQAGVGVGFKDNFRKKL
jgi:hypothetical protein